MIKINKTTSKNKIIDIVKIVTTPSKTKCSIPITRKKYLDFLTLGNWNPSEAKKYFKHSSGLNLHLPSKYGTNEIQSFYGDLLTLLKEKKPKDVKHVLISHGIGSSLDGTWTIAGTNIKVFDYINQHIPAGEKVLLTCCETGGKTNGKIGVGTTVLNMNNNLNPYKIVQSGKNEIIGYFTLDGRYHYYDDIKIIKK